MEDLKILLKWDPGIYWNISKHKIKHSVKLKQGLYNSTEFEASMWHFLIYLFIPLFLNSHTQLSCIFFK